MHRQQKVEKVGGAEHCWTLRGGPGAFPLPHKKFLKNTARRLNLGGISEQ